MKEMLKNRLSELRNEKKLTQQQLANALNITRGSIASYEAGNNIPPVEVLYSICDFLNISMDYILGRTDVKQLNNNTNCFSLSNNEKSLLSTYGKLNERSKGKLQERARVLLEFEDETSDHLQQQEQAYTKKNGTA